MEYQRRMVDAEPCDGCGETVRKSVMVDQYFDVYLEDENCGYQEPYDGEPITMIEDGIRA